VDGSFTAPLKGIMRIARFDFVKKRINVDINAHGIWRLANGRFFLFLEEQLGVRTNTFIYLVLLLIGCRMHLVGRCLQKVLLSGHETAQSGR
jgi:hypothetical protein